jgi:hypothetical protein
VATVARTRFWETGWEDDRQELAKFVGDLWTTLEAAVTYPSLLLSDEVAESLLASVQDLNPVIGTTQDALRKPAWISDAELDRAGLLGTQLQLKLGAYRSAETEYLEARDLLLAQGAASPEEKVPLVKRFKRLFRRGNIILGSIAIVFPPAHALTECKESAEASVEEAAEDAEERSGDGR